MIAVDRRRFDGHGRPTLSSGIDEHNRLSVATKVGTHERKQRILVSKLTRTADRQPCITRGVIPPEARVVDAGGRYHKLRTSKVHVLWNRTFVLTPDKSHIVYKQNLLRSGVGGGGDLCPICSEQPATFILLPCQHLFCSTCLDANIQMGGTRCPYCRDPYQSAQDLTRFKTDRKDEPKADHKTETDDHKSGDIEVAYSFVATEGVEYRLGATLEIKDFDPELKECLNGFHFHLDERDVLQWMEFLDIPPELLLPVPPQASLSSNDAVETKCSSLPSPTFETKYPVTTSQDVGASDHKVATSRNVEASDHKDGENGEKKEEEEEEEEETAELTGTNQTNNKLSYDDDWGLTVDRIGLILRHRPGTPPVPSTDIKSSAKLHQE